MIKNKPKNKVSAVGIKESVSALRSRFTKFCLRLDAEVERACKDPIKFGKIHDYELDEVWGEHVKRLSGVFGTNATKAAERWNNLVGEYNKLVAMKKEFLGSIKEAAARTKEVMKERIEIQRLDLTTQQLSPQEAARLRSLPSDEVMFKKLKKLGVNIDKVLEGLF